MHESVEDVKFTLLLSIALVVLVIFLFLRSLTATIIPSVAIPMACRVSAASAWAAPCGTLRLTPP